MESSGWVIKRLNEVHKDADKTAAVIVTKKEIKEGSSNVQFLGHLAKSKEFRQDLNLSNSYWFYHPETMKRVLVI
jgi:hypothetical protein